MEKVKLVAGTVTFPQYLITICIMNVATSAGNDIEERVVEVIYAPADMELRHAMVDYPWKK